jgi:hypothetical protein
MATAKQFLLIVAASVAASLLSEYLINNVRPVRRAVGSL